MSEIEDIENLMDLYEKAKSEFKRGTIENETFEKIKKYVENLGKFFKIPYEEILKENDRKIFLEKLEKFIDLLLLALDNKTQSLKKEADEKTKLPENYFKY